MSTLNADVLTFHEFVMAEPLLLATVHTFVMLVTKSSQLFSETL
ncbi:MAG: hypothetical protein AAF921_14280 [Cyanobacteria bacterium P01_D01_bin.44]